MVTLTLFFESSPSIFHDTQFWAAQDQCQSRTGYPERAGRDGRCMLFLTTKTKNSISELHEILPVALFEHFWVDVYPLVHVLAKSQ